jgi:hypothetical protein
MSGMPPLLLIILVGSAFLLPFWVYYDAKQNSSDDPVLWAFATFFGGPLGFILYLIFGRNRGRGGGGNRYLRPWD